MLTFKPTAIIYFFVIWVFLAGCAPEEEEETSQTASYSVGGSVSGLANGTVVIQNNGSDDLVVFQPGSSSSTISFSFPTKISSGNAFNVTVLVQPLAQTCTVNNGSGTVSGAVSSISIICSSQSFSVGGSVSGLTSSIVLQNNGSDDLTISQDSNFTFPTKVATGADYHVTVKTQPHPYFCTVSKNRGIMVGNVADVSVNCSFSTFTVSGTAAGVGSSYQLGLLNETVTIADNASDNESFQFNTPIASGGGYTIKIPSQPDNHTCSVLNGQRDNVTQFYNDLQAVCWKYIDNVSQGGINDNTSLDAITPSVSAVNDKLYVAWVENNKVRIKVYDNTTSWNLNDTMFGSSTNGLQSTNGTNVYNPILIYENITGMYAIWEDGVNGLKNIRYSFNDLSSSSDWFFQTSLNANSSNNAEKPDAISKDSFVYVVWSEINTAYQIRVKEIQLNSVSSLDGGGALGINDNTSHHASNPSIAESGSVFYAAWSEENSSGADNVSQIRAKKLDRSQNSSNTDWVGIDGPSRTAGMNYKSQYEADHPELVFHDSKLFAAWQEKNIFGKNQIRVAYYDDNLSITDNGTKLVLDSASSTTPLELNRSTCTLQLYDDNQTSLYSTFSQANLNNRSFYFSSFDNVTLTNSVIYNSTLTNVNLENSTVYNSVITNAGITLNKSVDNASIKQSKIYNSSIDNATINNSTLYDTTTAGATLYSSSIDNTTSYDSAVTIPELQSSCWVFVDGGDENVGMNKLVDADGNEDASQPQWAIHKSKLYITWSQGKSGATQTRTALFNDDLINPVWRTVDRYDEYGPSRFGLNYNEIKNASNPVMTSNGSKLFSVWSEVDNESKSQIRVVENPF